MTPHFLPALTMSVALALIHAVSLAYSPPQEVFDIGDQLQPEIQSLDSGHPTDDQTNVANPFSEATPPNTGEAPSSLAGQSEQILEKAVEQNSEAAPSTNAAKIIEVRQWLPYALIIFIFTGSAGLWYLTSRDERRASPLN